VDCLCLAERCVPLPFAQTTGITRCTAVVPADYPGSPLRLPTACTGRLRSGAGDWAVVWAFCIPIGRTLRYLRCLRYTFVAADCSLYLWMIPSLPADSNVSRILYSAGALFSVVTCCYVYRTGRWAFTGRLRRAGGGCHYATFWVRCRSDSFRLQRVICRLFFMRLFVGLFADSLPRRGSSLTFCRWLRLRDFDCRCVYLRFVCDTVPADGFTVVIACSSRYRLRCLLRFYPISAWRGGPQTFFLSTDFCRVSVLYRSFVVPDGSSSVAAFALFARFTFRVRTAPFGLRFPLRTYARCRLPLRGWRLPFTGFVPFPPPALFAGLLPQRYTHTRWVAGACRPSDIPAMYCQVTFRYRSAVAFMGYWIAVVLLSALDATTLPGLPLLFP